MSQVGSKPLAFVIDDDKSLGEAFKQALELCGFNAEHIIDSTQALANIIEQQPDVIMLDMQMPKMNGAEVLHAIRNNDKTAQVKVIVATANRFTIDQSIEDMADLVLQKPVSLNQIMQFATRMLKLRE